jgi:hypothetical protein
MAKVDREAMARLDGMDYALRRIKSIGIEEFEKELRNRNKSGMSLPLDNKQIQKELVKHQSAVLEFSLVLALATLHDEFGFGEKRAKKFRDLYMTGVDYINQGYAYLEEYKQGIKEQLGIEVNLV